MDDISKSLSSQFISVFKKMPKCLSIDRIIEEVLRDDGDVEDNVSEDDMESEQSDDELSNNDDENNDILLQNWMPLDGDASFNTKRFYSFIATPGLKVNMNDIDASIYSYFRLFFTDSMTENIINQTNIFAQQLKDMHPNREKPSFTLKKWRELTRDELFIYLAVVFMMGITHKPSLKSYWSTDLKLSTPIFSRLMSRDRFLQIRRVLHFNNNEFLDENDKLFKIRPLLETLKARLHEVYTPNKTLVVDEILELFKGRLGWKQFIPSKRERFGMKVYVAADSNNYVFNLEIYVGDGTNYSCESLSDLGVPYNSLANGTKIVLHLIELHLQKGYHVVVDNFFSSPELFSILLRYKTHAYGTVRTNRKLLPLLGNPVKGSCHGFQNNGLVYMKWSDPQKKKSKVVSMLSTLHDCTTVNTGKTNRSNQPIIKPSVIVDYCKNMGSVDSVSQIVHPYKVTRKGRKWFRKLFEMFCEIMALNASVLKSQVTGKTEPFLDVLLQLVDEIIIRHRSAASSCLETGRRQNDLLRLVERHFPDLIPPTANRQNPTRQCVVCSQVKIPSTGKNRRRETRYFCSSCNVALCVVPCFKKFHTLLHPSSE